MKKYTNVIPRSYNDYIARSEWPLLQDQIETDLMPKVLAPFKYKGDVATSADLPADPAQGDCYYIKADGYLTAWNGTAWKQASIDESDYLQELNGRIKKFYTSNLTAETVSDSDNGTIMNLRIYGRCTQGANPTPSNPQIIHAVTSPTLTITADGKTPQTATLSGIPLNAIPVTSGGNVTIDGQQYIADYVDVEKKQIVRMCKSTTFNGTEDWSTASLIAGASAKRYCIYNNFTTTNKVNDTSVICNRLTGISGNIGYRGNTEGIAVWEDTKAYINVYFTRGIDTVAEFKTWLASNNLTVIYPLATPTTESLTDAQVADFLALQSYYPTTTATVTSTDISGACDFIYPCSIAGFVEYIKQQTGDTRQFIYDLADMVDNAYLTAEYAATLAEMGD